EVQLVAHHQAAAAGRGDIGVVPVAGLLRHRTEGAAIRTRPVPAVATVADADLVGLLALRKLAAPDGEQAQEDALVGDAIEVVQLGRRLVVGPGRVEVVRADPHRRPGVLAPLGAADHIIFGFPVAPAPGSAPAVAQAIDPDLAERVVEHGAAVAASAGGLA